MRELSIWWVRVASLTRLTTRHNKTRIDACQSREVFSPDQPRKTCQNLERKARVQVKTQKLMRVSWRLQVAHKPVLIATVDTAKALKC